MKLMAYVFGAVGKFWNYMDKLMYAVGAPEVSGWFGGAWKAFVDIITPVEE